MTFKLWKMLKNASEGTSVPKNIFFLKISKFVQSFVECKVSLADGKNISRELRRQWTYNTSDSSFSQKGPFFNLLNAMSDSKDHFAATFLCLLAMLTNTNFDPLENRSIRPIWPIKNCCNYHQMYKNI